MKKTTSVLGPLSKELTRAGIENELILADGYKKEHIQVVEHYLNIFLSERGIIYKEEVVIYLEDDRGLVRDRMTTGFLNVVEITKAYKRIVDQNIEEDIYGETLMNLNLHYSIK